MPKAKDKKANNEEKNLGSEATCGVEKRDDKYFCVACGAVIDIDHEHCPECGNKVNWGSALIDTYRGSQFP